MTRSVRGSLSALTLVLALVLSGCASTGSTDGQGYISGDGSIARIDPAERGKPLELSGEDLAGDPLDVADLRGTVTVLNIWGSWCPPCREEMPELVAAQAELGDRAHFVGVNVRDNAAAAVSMNRSFGADWPSIFSPDGKALLPFVSAGVITPRTIPATIIVDEQGRLAATIIGKVTTSSTLVGLAEDVAKGL